MSDFHGERIERLSNRARLAASLYADAREARDKAIEEADIANYPVLRIVKRSRLSRSHVDKVVLARTAARQKAALKRMQLAPGPVDS